MGMSLILSATISVLKEKWFLLIFFTFTALMFFIFLYIPVKTIPGNDFGFQLTILGIKGVLLLIILAALTGLTLVMNLYVFKKRFSSHSGISLFSHGAFGSVSAFLGSIFGTASCAACVSSFFGFFGVGTTLFLLQYRKWVTLAAIGIMLLSLYFNSKKVLDICDSCSLLMKKK